MEWLDDAERGREAVRIGISVRRHAVVDPSGVGNTVRPEVAVARNDDRLVDTLAIHRGQPAFELDRGRVLACVDVGESEALRFE